MKVRVFVNVDLSLAIGYIQRYDDIGIVITTKDELISEMNIPKLFPWQAITGGIDLYCEK